MRSLYAFDTGHWTAMKISTAPFLPLSEPSDCSLPFASGSVKSSRVEPIAGGAGTSPKDKPPTTTKTALLSRNDVTIKDKTRFFFRICELLIERYHLRN